MKSKNRKKYNNGTSSVDANLALQQQKYDAMTATNKARSNQEAISGSVNAATSTVSPLLNSLVPGLGTGLNLATKGATMLYNNAFNKQANKADQGIAPSGLFKNNKNLRSGATSNRLAKQDEANMNRYGAELPIEQSQQIPVAKSGIYIKPENRGKFTASAKRAGESVQQHAKSVLSDPNATPLQKKRANFARNAAKWNKHPLGVSGVVFSSEDGLEVPKTLVNPDRINKKLERGSKKIKVIEIEGKETPEIHTDKTMTKIKTLGDNPHSKGGTKTIAEEGDVVFNTQNSKSKYNKILGLIEKKANGSKEANIELEKERQKLPIDKSYKNKDGNNGVDDGTDYSFKGRGIDNDDTSYNKGYDPAKDIGASARNAFEKTPRSKGSSLGRKENSSNLGNTLLEGAKGLPTAYNLVRGVSKPVKTQRNFYNPEQNKFVDTYDPLRKDIKDSYTTDVNNIRNVSGGSASTFLANKALATTNRNRNMQNLENDIYRQKQDIANQNVSIRNQAKATNLELTNQYNTQDLQNRAARNEFLAAGLEGASGLASSKLRENNIKAREDQYLGTLGSIYGKKYDKNTGEITTNKKGNKAIKVIPKTKGKK